MHSLLQELWKWGAMAHTAVSIIPATRLGVMRGGREGPRGGYPMERDEQNSVHPVQEFLERSSFQPEFIESEPKFPQ